MDYKKPVGTPKPQRPPIQYQGHTPVQTPNVQGSVPTDVQPRPIQFNPYVYNPDTPTKYSFTSPTGEGQYGQKTIYFPNKSMLESYIQGKKNVSSQEGQGYKTATGYQMGGNVGQQLLDYLFSDDEQENGSAAATIQEIQGEQEAMERQQTAIPEDNSYENMLAMQIVFSEANNPLTSPAGPKGFKVFANYAEGRRALENQLELYKSGQSAHTSGDETLAEATSIYAPPSENNTQNYINFVSKQLGVSPNTPIKQLNTKKWADAIEKIEGNKSGNNPGNLRR